MMKCWKKGLAFFLALFMVFGMLPLTASAAVIDNTGQPKDVEDDLVLSIYTPDGKFPGEPAVYGTTNYKNFNSNFKIQSGAVFKTSATDELNWDKIKADIVQGTANSTTKVWGVYDAAGTKDYFLPGASIIQRENEADIIRAIKSDVTNETDDDKVLEKYEVIWYVIKLQHSSGWFGRTEWHIDGVVKERAKISINYYGNGNTSGDAPLGVTNHTSGESYEILGKNTMTKEIKGVEVAFLGWSAQADGTGEEAGFYQPGDVIKPTESISLYAMWDTTTKHTATVNTYLDRVLTDDNEIHGSAHAHKLYLSTDHENYHELTSSATGVYTTQITGNGKFYLYCKEGSGDYVQIGNQQLTIYNNNGIMDVHHYSVNYKLDGGVFAETASKKDGYSENYLYGENVTAIADVPTKTGYRFIGWKDEAGNLIQPGAEITSAISQKTELTAQWEATVNVKINVTIYHEGGNGYDKMGTKDDVSLALVSRANDQSPYLEVEGKTLSLNSGSHEGFAFETTENHTLYTDYTYTNMAGGTVDYSVVTSKSGYDTTVTPTQDTDGNWTINVVMKYNPTNFDLNFTVKVDDNVPDQYIPDAAIVKVTFWSTDRVQWEIITQQEYGAPGVRVDIDPETRSGSGSYPVWMYESNGETPYGYRIQITSFVYPDGTIVPASNVVISDAAWTDNVYTATMSEVTGGQKYGTLDGAYYDVNSKSQKGTLEAKITMHLYDVTFNANGGKVNGQGEQTVEDQYKIPAFKGYVPTRDGGYVFEDWYKDQAYTKLAAEGEILNGNITLYAKWLEPLTISGTVTVAGTYMQDGKEVSIHDIDRATRADVILQEIRNDGVYDIDSKEVVFGEYVDEGTADYSFTKIPNDGKQYRIKVLLLNFTTTYDNETDTENENAAVAEKYTANEFNAYFGNDNVADVDAYLAFEPDSFYLTLRVDASKISEDFRPTEVLSEVLYRDTGDSHPYNVISQHTIEPFGVKIALDENGKGTNSTQSVWNWHIDGTLYDYQINISKYTSNGEVFSTDTAPFNIQIGEPHNAAEHSDACAGDAEEELCLKATLVPKEYMVTFDLNAGTDSVEGMDDLQLVFVDEDGNEYIIAEYGVIHTWGMDTQINQIPTREGYIFKGWVADVAGAYADGKIGAAVHQNVVLTAQWEAIQYTVTTVASPAEGGQTSGYGTYAAGTSVTVKAVASDDYRFDGWYENGVKVSVAEEYTFEVTGDHTLTAKFYLKPLTTYTNDYAYIFGYNDSTMGAEGPLTRREAAVMVHRLAKQNDQRGEFNYAAVLNDQTFADVKPKEWCFSGIEYIAYRGGFNVQKGGNVQPYAHVTRGEVAKFIALGLGFTPDKTLSHMEYAQILCAYGYLKGDENGDLKVNDKMSRAEFCTMFNRIIGRENAALIDINGNAITAETYGFTDLDSTKWYYADMLRATSAYEGEYVSTAKRAQRNPLDDYS